MLPSFPKIEKLRRDASLELVRQRAANLTGILQEISSHVQFEGRQTKVFRHDDTASQTPMHTATGEAIFSRMPLAQFTEQALEQELEKVAHQLAKSMSEQLFADIETAIEEVGNVVDARGQPLSEGLVLKMFETIDHEFEPDGTWKPPTLVASPQAFDRLVKNADAHGSSSGEFNESLRKILEKKRDDFLRREDDRILVG